MVTCSHRTHCPGLHRRLRAAVTTIACVLLLAAWWMMGRAFPTATAKIELEMDAAFDRSRHAKVFYVTFAVTVALWLTEAVHGLPSGVVGFLPVVVFLAVAEFFLFLQ